jgi:hypothetical protein
MLVVFGWLAYSEEASKCATSAGSGLSSAITAAGKALTRVLMLNLRDDDPVPPAKLLSLPDDSAPGLDLHHGLVMWVERTGGADRVEVARFDFVEVICRGLPLVADFIQHCERSVQVQPYARALLLQAGLPAGDRAQEHQCAEGRNRALRDEMRYFFYITSHGESTCSAETL